MIELHDWIKSARFEDKPWLVLGKGPSFSRRGEFDLSAFNLLSLNDVVAEQEVDVAHILDVDVVGNCAERLLENCRHLVMARRPHVGFAPGERLLEEWFADYPVLEQLDREGRLIWYNASTSPPLDGAPVVQVTYFSSEAALNILGEMGAGTVRSLGIDGGTRYGDEFSRLEPLRNSLPSFDSQFRELEDAAERHGLDYDTLLESMHVFCGLDESQIVAARVLEYTIRRHASRPVRFHPMLNVPTPTPKDPANRGRTGFSFSRFHIPKLMGYKGRALYVDADMQVFGDLAEVFDLPFGERKVLCTRQDEPPPQWKDSDWFHPGRQMSVMLLDCERLDWDVDRIVGDLDAGRYGYRDLMFDLCVVEPDEIGDDIPPVWNHLEHYQPGETKLLHYTNVPTQPWKNDENALKDLWEPVFKEALAAQVVRQPEVERLALQGHIKRSLAGLAPPSRPRAALDKGIGKAMGAMHRLEQRFPVLKHPRVMRVRSRAGTLLSGGPPAS